MNQLKDFYAQTQAHDEETGTGVADRETDPTVDPPGYWDEDFFGWKRRDLVHSLGIMLLLLGIIWIAYFVSLGFPQIKEMGGIVPRTAHGLLGLLFSGFLHADWQHITSNSGPFFILGYLLCIRGRLEFLCVMLLEMFLAGGIVWLVGRSHVYYIGASGFIFCWFGYLLTVSAFERPVRWSSVITTAFVFLLYAGLIFGVLPSTSTTPSGATIAWESHLIGFIVGVLSSLFFYYIYPRIPEYRQKCPWSLPSFLTSSSESSQRLPDVSELGEVDDVITSSSDSDETSGFLAGNKGSEERDKTSIQVDHWGKFPLG